MADQLAPVQQFEYLPGMTLRVLNRGGEPWFVAADVCKALDITNPTDALKILDQEERARFNLGRQGAANIISESGLYLLVLKSRKPEAKAFQKWVTAEVLPSIRKTGGTTDRQGRYIPLGQTHMEPSPRDTPEGPYWSPLRWS